MKINKRVEDIFAHAVALTQSGRLRSTVYCKGRLIYILNQDHGVILRFRLRSSDAEFSEPVSFTANDYDSNEVSLKDGEICFLQEGAGFDRIKSCRTPSMTPSDVHKIWRSYKMKEKSKAVLHKDLLGLLNPALSHIEFSAKKGKLRIVQRDIYAGNVINITRKAGRGLGLQVEDELEDFEPLALRTNDFMALFSFVDSFTFFFHSSRFVWADSVGSKMIMRALIAQCKYDELGGISGRKVKKIRRSK